MAPTLAFLAGVALVSWLPLPLAGPGLVALAALGGAVSRGSVASWKWVALLVAWTSAGALAATVAGLPVEPPPAFVGRHRPVTTVLEVEGPWRQTAGGWSARSRVELLRHRGHVHPTSLPVWLSLPAGGEGARSYPPPPGSLLRLRGFLSRPPSHANGVVTPPGPWRFSVPSERFVEVEGEPGPVHRWAHTLRRRLERRLDLLDAVAAPKGEGDVDRRNGPGLARALVLGDSSRLDPLSVLALRRCGLGHLLALSGLHLGLLLAILLVTLRTVRSLVSAIRSRLRLAGGPSGGIQSFVTGSLVLVVVLPWLAVAGLRPSLSRASLVAACLGASLLLQRPPVPLNSLALAALLLVIYRPEVLQDPGFQLSFAATAGLFLVATTAFPTHPTPKVTKPGRQSGPSRSPKGAGRPRRGPARGPSSPPRGRPWILGIRPGGGGPRRSPQSAIARSSFPSKGWGRPPEDPQSAVQESRECTEGRPKPRTAAGIPPRKTAGEDPRADDPSPLPTFARITTRAFTATLAAQLATLPWAGPLFHGLHPAAPVLHLPALPWITVTLAVAFLASAFLLVAPLPFLEATAPHLVTVLDLLARPLAWLRDSPASPAWFLPWLTPPPEAWLAALLLGGLAGWWWGRRRHRGATRAGFAVALLTLTLAGAGALPSPSAHPRLVMLDVGQGTAVLIQDGPRAVLVDGGGRTGGPTTGGLTPEAGASPARRSPGGGVGPRVLLPALLAEGVRRLDAVVLTHPDLDHCGGLVELGAYLPIDQVWMADGWRGDPCADRLATLPGAERRRLAAGAAGRLGRWRWKVLHPELSPPGSGTRQADDRNGRSLVMTLESPGGRRVLLPGDLEARGEAALLRRFRGANRSLLAADVLLVGHHGSRTSSGTPFLAAVGRGRPFRALISAGRANPYGHPAPEVVERLRRRGAQVFATSVHGGVRLTFLDDGTVRAEVGRGGG